jgi:phage terminase large subunit-like protein
MAGKKSVPADLSALKISPEVAWYMESRGIPLPDCPPRFKTPEPSKVKGARFDPDRVDWVMTAFAHLRHTQGRWAGMPLKPDPWQVAYILAPVFGWVHPDPDNPEQLVRVIRKLFVEVPRKNGKSTLLGGIGLYLTGADGEAGAQVLVAATTKDQAGFVFKPIKTLVEKSPGLKGNFRAVGMNIHHPKSGSYMQAISSVSDAQHGANIHGAILDELHVYKTSDMVDVLETGTGSRAQPLIAIITTADENRQGSVYDARRVKIEQLSAGTIREPDQYGVVWCADRDDDPFVEETWRKANPGFGVSPTRAYMRSASQAAQNSPAELAKFMRLHLGVRISDVVKWLPLGRWDATGQLVGDAEWRGLTVFGGLDLSTASDFTAFALRGADMAHVLCWVPEENVNALARQTGAPLRRWHDMGWLRFTEGNVVDYARVRADIEAEVDRLECVVQSIGYDPWNASETVQKLADAGFQMVPITQGYSNLSAPAKSLERLVLGSTPAAPLLRTNGNPVLRWMADCVEVRQDDNGNIKPVKPDRVKSAKRIDGIVALIMAERELIAGLAEESSPVDEFFAAVAARRSADST